MIPFLNFSLFKIVSIYVYVARPMFRHTPSHPQKKLGIQLVMSVNEPRKWMMWTWLQYKHHLRDENEDENIFRPVSVMSIFSSRLEVCFCSERYGTARTCCLRAMAWEYGLCARLGSLSLWPWHGTPVLGSPCKHRNTLCFQQGVRQGSMPREPAATWVQLEALVFLMVHTMKKPLKKEERK